MKKIAKIVLIVVLGVIMAGAIFWVGKKFGEGKETNQTKNDQKFELESQLQQLKKELQKETDSTKKQELERKIGEKKQQIQNLGGPTTPPAPNQKLPTKNPPKTSRQLTVKCNGVVGGKHEFINVSNPQERIYIDTKNKVFYSDDALYIKGNQYTVSFNQEDAAKKGNNFIFDESNDKFQLTPISSPTPQPSPPLPNNNSGWINIEVKWGGGSGKKNYWLLTSADWPKTKKKIFISKKNVAVEGKKFAHKITPNLRIGFYEKDVSQKISNEEWLFDENNNKFALTHLENWPDGPNYQDQIEEEGPKTVEVLRYGGFRNDYIGFNNMLTSSIAANLLKNYWVHFDHPEIKRLDLNSKLVKDKNALNGKKYIISFDGVNKIEHDSHFFFNQNNDSLEIKEEN